MEDPQRKTFKLPAGAFQVRAQQPEYQRDDAALVRWLEEHVMPDYLELVKKPKWGELKKIIETKGGVATVAGEVVDGITVVPRGLKFTVATEEV
ncbi:MAG: Bacteriophage Mu Gam like protein [Firmicutes bacterium ADurb.BinA052]|nr:MAG: Bacteriophage Mu Gam like protein [Firmicutes bacterium ADurb.BinA052]